MLTVNSISPNFCPSTAKLVTFVGAWKSQGDEVLACYPVDGQAGETLMHSHERKEFTKNESYRLLEN